MTSMGLSQKLDEKLELVQKARLGPGYERGASVLSRCVTYSDSGLTWEADPRTGSGSGRAWTSCGASTGEPRRREAKRATGPRSTGT